MFSDCESFITYHLCMYNYPFTHIHPYLSCSLTAESFKPQPLEKISGGRHREIRQFRQSILWTTRHERSELSLQVWVFDKSKTEWHIDKRSQDQVKMEQSQSDKSSALNQVTALNATVTHYVTFTVQHCAELTSVLFGHWVKNCQILDVLVRFLALFTYSQIRLSPELNYCFTFFFVLVLELNYDTGAGIKELKMIPSPPGILSMSVLRGWE